MNRWPTVPVAPRTATLIFLDGAPFERGAILGAGLDAAVEALALRLEVVVPVRFLATIDLK